MLKLSANKILLATSALLLCAGFAQAQTESPTPLVPSPSTVAIGYQLPATPGTLVTVTLTAAASTDTFVINPASVPFWLTLGGSGLTGLGGTATTSGVSVTFVANSYAGTLPAGTYTASVQFAVSGYQNLSVPVTLSVEPVASTLSVQTVTGGAVLPLTSGTTYTGTQISALNWTYGSTPYPTIPLTILSSDAPASFAATVASSTPSTPSWVNLSTASGIAYNFGTGLNISFLPDVLKNAAVGATLSFTLNIVYGPTATPTTLAYTFTITVEQPYATLSTTGALFPAYTAPVTSGTLKVVVSGTGFYATASGISPTLVDITYGPSGSIVGPVLLTSLSAEGGAVSVVNPTTMVLTIPYEDATPVNILGQNVVITISSALSGQPTQTATLNVTTNPYISAVVDGGAMLEPAAGVTPTFAPYELISIFGNNFCPTACPNGVVAQPGTDARYPNTLTAGGSLLSVVFNNQTGTLLANAYLIFANDTQINALVPSTAVPSTTLTGLQIVVESGLNSSNTYLATPVAANPGIFTTAASGQGQGAILNKDYSVNSQANPAVVGDPVFVYVTGLGVPNSTAASSTSTKTPVFPTSCFQTSLYVAGEGLANPATADGAVLNGSIWGVGNLPPCFATKNYVTATINNVAATVDYAGWVSGSVTGLYQVNLTVPKATTSTTAVQVPVMITANGVSAQTGVTLYIKN
ncbi:MAG TPA: hypothetical protein VME17_18475 [Bryobacteraceae bacterium]|nr:hypothetical protein [Bryobacteraceae bacterium]